MIVRQRIACMTIVAILAPADVASMADVQHVIAPMVVVDVDEPRPLSAAARQLERQLGLAVTYEDGSYVAPGDIVDISGMGGEFSVVDVGGGFHVVPTARRGVTGELQPYASPLSAPIDCQRRSVPDRRSSQPSLASSRRRPAG